MKLLEDSQKKPKKDSTRFAPVELPNLEKPHGQYFPDSSSKTRKEKKPCKGSEGVRA